MSKFHVKESKNKSTVGAEFPPGYQFHELSYRVGGKEGIERTVACQMSYITLITSSAERYNSPKNKEHVRADFATGGIDSKKATDTSGDEATPNKATKGGRMDDNTQVCALTHIGSHLGDVDYHSTLLRSLHCAVLTYSIGRKLLKILLLRTRTSALSSRIVKMVGPVSSGGRKLGAKALANTFTFAGNQLKPSRQIRPEDFHEAQKCFI
ncbi:hypothetical protein BJ878DRAFT_124062 [Calycina marina]|uniref:Uncharacterized protein n=1 Tax=Calycina marina TaxID=1763456 RepID=A0A9P7Z148_9HELO|nr:hypothetical protein BJ878DRAFT_124062 [Calycina marina]